MPSLYPFFECTRCKCRVQMATDHTTGKLPTVAVNDRRTKLSSQFDHGDFSIHCRGQGQRYYTQQNALAPYPTRMEFTHFNFSGPLSGLCCFCASLSGIEYIMIVSRNACFNCTRKEALRREFARLYRLAPSSCPWAALPSVVLDKILCALLGSGLNVMDGRA